jgi:uncharacterized protein (DUF952 family)
VTLCKILPAESWRRAGDVVPWSEDDERDGFMHLSTLEQVLDTARRHFPGRRDLVALEIDEGAIADPVIYERSRSGALFPHLYGSLPRSAVIRVTGLAWTDGGYSFVSCDT